MLTDLVMLLGATPKVFRRYVMLAWEVVMTPLHLFSAFARFNLNFYLHARAAIAAKRL